MWGGTDEKEAIQTIHKAFDKGITLIDTAPVYGFGKSEEIVGKAIKQYGNRDQLVIATKVGLNWKDGKVSRNSSPKRIVHEIQDSLRRLQVDHIDLYQVHWPDSGTPFFETAQTLKEQLEEGTIRAIGVSNFSVEQMDEFRQWTQIHANQPPFNLFEQESARTILPYCGKHQIATLGYGSLCRGLLSGKMRKDTQFSGDDLRKNDPKFKAPQYEHYLRCVEGLDTWAKTKHRRSVLALAVRWALDKGISVALWGARKPEQLDELENVLGWKLVAADFQEIDQILDETLYASIGPEFMAPP